MLFTIFYAMTAAKFYYQKKSNITGLALGIIMTATALLLDIFITVPFVEIPNGRNYQSFFSSPVLWLLVFITIMSIFFYWRKNIKAKN